MDDLIKRDSKSNCSLLKWLKVLHAANKHDEEYDPVKARNGQKISPYLVSRQLRECVVTFFIVHNNLAKSSFCKKNVYSLCQGALNWNKETVNWNQTQEVTTME